MLFRSEVILKAERLRIAKIKNDFELGSKKRDADLLAFKNLRVTNLAKVEKLNEEATALDATLDAINDGIRDLKQKYVQSRLAAMKQVALGDHRSTDLLKGLSTPDLLEAFIVHACQISGELVAAAADDSDKDEALAAAADDDTCSALRVAALDLGLTWNEEENFDNFDRMKG